MITLNLRPHLLQENLGIVAKKTQYDQYIHDVETGKQLSCDYVKLAIDRHIQDLRRKDLIFDRERADKAIKFFKASRHTKGQYQNQFFQLQDWQAFIIASVYGWKWKDTGLRRYRKVYNEVARKNGKTELTLKRWLSLQKPSKHTVYKLVSVA